MSEKKIVKDPYVDEAGMVECRHCYAKIDKRAKVCPYCRKKQKKSKAFGIIFLIVLILIAVVLGLYVMRLYSKHKLTERARTLPRNDFVEGCQEVTYEELMRSDDAMKGQDVTFRGEIIQVAGNDIYRLAIQKPDELFSSDAVILTISGNTGKIIENDEMIVYGTSMGMQSYQGLMGQTVTVPHIYVAYYDSIVKQD